MLFAFSHGAILVKLRCVRYHALLTPNPYTCKNMIMIETYITFISYVDISIIYV